MADLFGIFAGWWGSFKGGWIWIFWIFIVGAIIFIVGSIIKGKFTYKYPVRIFRIRENGKVLEHNCKGGYINRKNSAPFFKIKLGRLPWQNISLSTTPNPMYMDEQDRVYYKQIDVGTFIQLKREFNPNTKVVLTPVECDVKYGAILDIHRVKSIISTESAWKKIAPYFALVLIFITAILGWWFVMDSKCPVP